MIFDKEETKNLLNMLRSADNENAIIAFEALKGVDTKKYIGELFVLYKFGKQKISKWDEACPECSRALHTAMTDVFDDNTPMSTGACISYIIDNKGSNQSIELFMEMFTENMVGFLSQMGYPVDKFDINVKLKDGQSTKS